MTHPTPTPRQHELAIDALAALPVVACVTFHEDAPGHDTPSLSVVLPEGVDRVPPGVCRVLARHDFGIVDVSPQGDQLVVSIA